jgi:hypothetical protein
MLLAVLASIRMRIFLGASQGFTLRSNLWQPSFFPFGEETTKSVSISRFHMLSITRRSFTFTCFVTVSSWGLPTIESILSASIAETTVRPSPS